MIRVIENIDQEIMNYKIQLSKKQGRVEPVFSSEKNSLSFSKQEQKSLQSHEEDNCFSLLLESEIEKIKDR